MLSIRSESPFHVSFAHLVFFITVNSLMTHSSQIMTDDKVREGHSVLSHFHTNTVSFFLLSQGRWKLLTFSAGQKFIFLARFNVRTWHFIEIKLLPTSQ